MSKINSNTRFHKFNITLYERLDIFYNHIDDLFNTKDCSFQILKFQFEVNYNPSEPGRYHAQGFAKLRLEKQIYVENYDSKTKKGSGIKEKFEANIYLNFCNGTDEEYLAYVEKDYDQYKNPNHNLNPKKGQKCKCDFTDLSKFCKYCDSSCHRPFARISKDPKIASPFDFIFNKSKF